LKGGVEVSDVEEMRREYDGVIGLAGESGPEEIRRFEGFRGANLGVKATIFGAEKSTKDLDKRANIWEEIQKGLL